MSDGWGSWDEVALDINKSFNSRQFSNKSRGSANNRPNWRNRNDNHTWRNHDDGQNEGNESSGRNWRNQNNGRFRNSESKTVMHVPTSYVGMIIGRGGVKINEMQQHSGARIKVTKETEGENTAVEIIGSEESIGKAKDLIENLIKEKEQEKEREKEKQKDREAIKAIKFIPPDFSKPSPSVTKPPQLIDWDALKEESDKYEKERLASLPPIKKNFYFEAPEVAGMSRAAVEKFRVANNNIIVSRVSKKEEVEKIPIPNPVTTFEQAFKHYPEIMDEIKKQGFEHPSPIQCQAWPALLSGEDLIGIAQTGTGKTLAFLLPALIHIDGQSVPRVERNGPNVLILAPTRELALQIDREVKKYNYKGIKALCVYGGGDRKEQISVLVNNDVNIIIATPGRLNDLVMAGYINVEGITYVVLDEADRMLDMGFEPQIRKVLYRVRSDRQTVMTSATWPMGVRRLAASYMVDPIQVHIGNLDLAACHSVIQHIVMLDDSDEVKFQTLLEFVSNMAAFEKAIVFCGKKTRADDISSELTLKGFECVSMHGDLEQSDREQALADIADGTIQVLIATDLASRGLDIDDITHVVNYDFPRNIEEYVHRVGRTGRAGKTGCSISYFTRADWSSAKDLIKILEEANQYVPEELYKMSERYEAWREKKGHDSRRSGGGRGGRGQNRWAVG